MNSESGGENYIMPLEIMHDSKGTPYGKAFEEGARKIAEKHKRKIKRLQTTIKDARCSAAGVKLWFFNRRFKTVVKFFLKITGLLPLARKINKKRKIKKGFFVGED